MTPKQKIKWLVLTQMKLNPEADDPTLPAEVTPEVIDEVYSKVVALDLHWDIQVEVREGEVETNIPAEWSRHYESKSVAAKAPDGSWVGWTYWYGGGKHSEPGAIPWMDDAYDLTCVEEPKVVVIQTFAKIEPTTPPR